MNIDKNVKYINFIKDIRLNIFETTQEAFAKALNIQKQTIAAIEKARIPVSIIMLLKCYILLLQCKEDIYLYSCDKIEKIDKAIMFLKKETNINYINLF